jgi:menaquinone-9 beta-reductase
MSGIIKEYDIVVIGSGIAGMSLLHNLYKNDYNKNILLVEKQSFPRDKICGDLISNKCFSLLIEIFPNIKKSIFNKIKFFDENKRISNVDHYTCKRFNLDYEIYKHILKTNYKIKENCKTKIIKKEGEYFFIKVNDNIIKTKFLVGADGSLSIVSKFLKLKNNLVYSLRSYQNTERKINICKFRSGHNEYYWDFSILNGEKNIGYFQSIFNKKKFIKIKNIFFKNKKVKGAPINLLKVKGEKFYIEDKIIEKNYAVIGDSACLVHPYNGEGIHIALYMGKLLSDFILKKNNKKEYLNELRNFINKNYSLKYWENFINEKNT